MESAAHYWLALYTRLRKEGYRVVVLNPVQIDAMRGMLIHEAKTDNLTPRLPLSLRLARCWGPLSSARSGTSLVSPPPTSWPPAQVWTRKLNASFFPPKIFSEHCVVDFAETVNGQ